MLLCINLYIFLLFDCPASLEVELQPCSLFASVSRLCPAHCVCAEAQSLVPPGHSRLPLCCSQSLVEDVPGAARRGCSGAGEGWWSVARAAPHTLHSPCLPCSCGEGVNSLALVLTAMQCSQHRQGLTD